MPTKDWSEYETIDVAITERVAVVTLDQPEQLNAWSWLMWAELGDAYAQLDDDDEVRAIVLTGAGSAFCAGAALQPEGRNWTSGSAREIAERRYPNGRPQADRLNTPVIAAINGAAVGAGMSMAMHADLRIAAEDAKIGFVFHRRGVVPDGDLLWSLPRQIGFAPAMDLLMTGRLITGSEAMRLGLVSRTAPREELHGMALDMAHDMARYVAPVPAAITKRMARRFLSNDNRSECSELQYQLFRWSVEQADAAEGVNAFMQRRPPEWTLKVTKDLPDLIFEEPID